MPVMAEARPSEIPQITIILQDQAKDKSSRDAAAHLLVEIAQTYPDYRAQCVAILTATLERYQRNPIELNTSLIGHLITLKASESAALVQQVVKAGEYDQSIGDWRRISRELGVVEKRPEPLPQPEASALQSAAALPKPPSDKPPEFFSPISPDPNPAAAAATIAAGPRLTPKQKEKLRDKRKQERKAKKQNRRR
jgi:hypothetical protein